MNDFWLLFPRSLLEIENILQLPNIAAGLYVLLLLIMLFNISYRKELLFFMLLSFVASAVTVLGLKGGLLFSIAPMLLIAVILVPVIMFFLKLISQGMQIANIWILASFAGIAHSIGWAVWVYAISGS